MSPNLAPTRHGESRPYTVFDLSNSPLGVSERSLFSKNLDRKIGEPMGEDVAYNAKIELDRVFELINSLSLEEIVHNRSLIQKLSICEKVLTKVINDPNHKPMVEIKPLHRQLLAKVSGKELRTNKNFQKHVVDSFGQPVRKRSLYIVNSDEFSASATSDSDNYREQPPSKVLVES